MFFVSGLLKSKEEKIKDLKKELDGLYVHKEAKEELYAFSEDHLDKVVRKYLFHVKSRGEVSKVQTGQYFPSGEKFCCEITYTTSIIPFSEFFKAKKIKEKLQALDNRYTD